MKGSAWSRVLDLYNYILCRVDGIFFNKVVVFLERKSLMTGLLTPLFYKQYCCLKYLKCHCLEIVKFWFPMSSWLFRQVSVPTVISSWFNVWRMHKVMNILLLSTLWRYVFSDDIYLVYLCLELGCKINIWRYCVLASDTKVE